MPGRLPRHPAGRRAAVCRRQHPVWCERWRLGAGMGEVGRIHRFCHSNTIKIHRNSIVTQEIHQNTIVDSSWLVIWGSYTGVIGDNELIRSREIYLPSSMTLMTYFAGYYCYCTSYYFIILCCGYYDCYDYYDYDSSHYSYYSITVL